MKLRNIKNLIAVILLLNVLISCRKEFPNIFNMFDVTLRLHKSQPYAVGEDAVITIGAADSVLIDYTIESPGSDMYQIALYRTGASSPAIKIPISDVSERRTYSGQFKLYASDLGAGNTSYRIWAYDKDGVYLGDGGKLITISVTPDFLYFTNRRVLSPDFEEKNPCYLSINDGKLYSYSTGAEHSASIDLGIFTRLDTIRNSSGEITSTPINNYLYSLSADPLPFTFYDISSWTKRETLFSSPVKGSINDFNEKLNTGVKIKNAALDVAIDLKNITTPLATNQFIYFKTPEDKYGVIFIQAMGNDYGGQRYTQISYKLLN